MAIETICKGCAAKLSVADEHAGKRARCPKCGFIYTVPGEPRASEPGPREWSPGAREAGEREAGEPPADRTGVPGPAEGPQNPFGVELAGETPKPHAALAGSWLLRTPDGNTYGPVSRAELDAWMREGRITSNCYLQAQGQQDWHPATAVYPAMVARHAMPAPPENPFRDDATGPGNPYASAHASGYQLPPGMVSHRGHIVLTLAIVGLVLCFIIGPCSFTGPIAWAMGAADMKQMREGKMDPSGMASTQTGLILGMIQTILILIGLSLLAFVVLAA